MPIWITHTAPKKKTQKMALTDFFADTSEWITGWHGGERGYMDGGWTVLMVATGDSWADEMDNLPTARMSSTQRVNEPDLISSRAEGPELWTEERRTRIPGLYA
jgi:hypothetical protein